MGLDISVLIVDWAHLEATPHEARLALLEDAALPEVSLPEVDRGWVWPPAPSPPWYGLYEFHRTLGLFKPHYRAGEAWEDVRHAAEPALRAALDPFLTGLFWEGPEGEAEHVENDGVLPDNESAMFLPLLRLLARPPHRLPHPGRAVGRGRATP